METGTTKHICVLTRPWSFNDYISLSAPCHALQPYALIHPHACTSVTLIDVALCHCAYASVLHRSMLEGSAPDNIREAGLKLNESNCQPGARLQGLIMARHMLPHSGLSCPLHFALPVCSSGFLSCLSVGVHGMCPRLNIDRLSGM